MSNLQFVLVAYDITVDKRRTKLHNALLNYGTPVQYSIFECLLTADDIVKMKKQVYRIIKRQDHVRFYHICGTCLAKVETSGFQDVLRELPSAIIVEPTEEATPNQLP